MTMKFSLPSEDALPSELRDIIREAGAVLGTVVEREAGKKIFQIVENMRAEMASIRGEKPEVVSEKLRRALVALRKLSKEERHTVAKAFTFFLEVMNSGENAYRSHRLMGKTPMHRAGKHPIIYVLTAHPTEARAPSNIAIFHGVQDILLRGLMEGTKGALWRIDLSHQLELAWRAYPTRERAPTVKDEAEHIYRTSLRARTLRTILTVSQEVAPVYLRTWVGGDKDGHPGVSEVAMRESLTLSRGMLIRFVDDCLSEVKRDLDLLPKSSLQKSIIALRKAFSPLRELKGGDAKRAAAVKLRVHTFAAAYEKELGALHPELRHVKRLLHVMPGLVVPLELREASDVLMGTSEKETSAAIHRMLKFLATISKGGNPRWYVRGFIVSMTEKIEHLAKAEEVARKNLGGSPLPIIPLFETVPDLQNGPEIIRQLFKHPKLSVCLKKEWNNQLEIMVGYSDSSKTGGVLPSRLAIAGAMHALDEECRKAGVRVVFFQGSGGSVDRGGGSVEDQVAWWPRSALETYKVTIQGEMVERSFSSPEITRGQVARIAESVTKELERKPKAPSNATLMAFADSVREEYRKMIHREDFLEVVAKATPYAHLSELKIGSRPARRTTEISVAGLRAIPWVLCWTQTRVLFITWWGVGTAWRGLPNSAKKEMREAFAQEPVFTSYVKALGYTLAKSELPLWRIYLENSGMAKEAVEKIYAEFVREQEAAWEMVKYLSQSDNPLWFRPWLGASIRLRAPMIHPLNLLQVLAMESSDYLLFRTAATGISAGMMTTG